MNMKINGNLTFLKAKLHGVICTEVDLDYEGSILIDEDLMDKVGIRIYEQVDVYNKTNGNRHTTYALPLPRGSNKISVNGAGAHLTDVGDELIICAYIQMEYKYVTALDRTLVKGYEPKVYIAKQDT